MEIVVTPLLLGGFGLLLDSWLGTGRLLGVIFGLFGVVGIFAKLKLGYDKAMVVEESGKPWTRGRTSTTGPGESA